LKKTTHIPGHWLHQQLDSILEPAGVNYLINSFNTSAPVSIRVNIHKTQNQPELTRVPWCHTGYYLPHRPNFTLDPNLHAGVYYVQEASSMFVHHTAQIFLNQYNFSEPVIALDLCAAPGGKSTLLGSLLVNRGCVVANEVVKKRFHILEENVTKWGTGNIIPVCAETAKWALQKEWFDFILVDAPCSGEGLWRKNKEAVNEWSPENVALCANRQHNILNDAWKALKPGGWMVYSTCTLNVAENEENTKKFLQENPDSVSVQLEVKKEWGIFSCSDNFYSYRFFPHLLDGEGFYITVIQKKGKPSSPSITDLKKEKQANPCADVFLHEMHWWHNKTGIACAVPANLAHVIHKFRSFEYSTLPFEVFADSNISMPMPSLAFRYDLNKLYFPIVQLNNQQVINYLSCNTAGFSLEIPERTSHLVTWNNHALGFIRRIRNSVRIDYLKNWRILKPGPANPLL
jgi:16S rRNA C967 or C1407 C5-methylase (RsmB/RsmF family)